MGAEVSRPGRWPHRAQGLGGRRRPKSWASKGKGGLRGARAPAPAPGRRESGGALRLEENAVRGPIWPGPRRCQQPRVNPVTGVWACCSLRCIPSASMTVEPCPAAGPQACPRRPPLRPPGPSPSRARGLIPSSWCAGRLAPQPPATLTLQTPPPPTAPGLAAEELGGRGARAPSDHTVPAG